MQLERVMSMMRYWPAKGTAGLARSRVRGKSRSPAPPASRTPSVSLMVLLPRSQCSLIITTRYSVLQSLQSTGTDYANSPSATSLMHKTVDDSSESRVYHAMVTSCAYFGAGSDSQTTKPGGGGRAAWKEEAWAIHRPAGWR